MISFTFNDPLPVANGAYFGVVHYLDSVNNFANFVIGKFNIGIGIIDWAAGVPGSATLNYEITTQPHVLQKKGRVFSVVPVNTATAGQIGCVLLSVFTIQS
jgi:hypothetical protein